MDTYTATTAAELGFRPGKPVDEPSEIDTVELPTLDALKNVEPSIQVSKALGIIAMRTAYIISSRVPTLKNETLMERLLKDEGLQQSLARRETITEQTISAFVSSLVHSYSKLTFK